jgi:hypothetical protein
MFQHGELVIINLTALSYYRITVPGTVWTVLIDGRHKTHDPGQVWVEGVKGTFIVNVSHLDKVSDLTPVERSVYGV